MKFNQMIKRSLFLWLISMFSFSCKQGLLDKTPPVDIPTNKVFSSVSDLEVGINGAYEGAQSASAFGGAYKLIPDIFSDMIVVNPDAFQRGQVGGYFNAYQRQLYRAIDNVWNQSYIVIDRANNIIDVIERKVVPVTNDFERENVRRIKGEAYFLRAYAHFELVRLFSHQYGINQDVPESGIIIRDKPTVNRQAKARSTVREVYEFVQRDLDSAIALLPTAADPSKHLSTYKGIAGGRAVKDAAKALKARVYFQKATDEDDEVAKAVVEEIIGSTAGVMTQYSITGDRIDRVSDNFLYKRGISAANETLFQINNLFNPATRELNSTAKTLVDSYTITGDPDQGGAIVLSGSFPPFYLMSRIFTDSARFATSDARLNVFTYPAGINRYMLKYYAVQNAPVDINIPLIRASELLLIRAELAAKRGDATSAIADLNLLRARANSPALGALGGDLLMREVFRERLRELFGEGDRLHYFKRTAKMYPFASKVMRTGPGQANRIRNTVAWDDDCSIFQLPDSELASNPLAKRNPCN